MLFLRRHPHDKVQIPALKKCLYMSSLEDTKHAFQATVSNDYKKTTTPSEGLPAYGETGATGGRVTEATASEVAKSAYKKSFLEFVTPMTTVQRLVDVILEDRQDFATSSLVKSGDII